MEPDQQPNRQRAIADRRAQLARYRTAYAETYGQNLSIDALESDDIVLQRLLQEGKPLELGHRVVVTMQGALEGLTGRILSTGPGWVHVKADTGAIYQVPTDALLRTGRPGE